MPGQPRRKAVLIIFPSPWLAFSPSTINLYDALAPKFDVTIVAREPEYFSSQRLPNRNVEYVQVPVNLRQLAARMSRFARVLGLAITPDLLCALLLLNRARRLPCDLAIGIDFQGLWVAQHLSRNAHLLSLEAHRDDPFFGQVDRNRISSVMIQSDERYDYLFPDHRPRHFVVQNAPVYRDLAPTPTARAGLVFCGTAIREFGIFNCLDFLKQFPSFSLTVHGAMPEQTRDEIRRRYPELLEGNRLLLDHAYLDSEAVPRYLSRFLIGFCLYDFSCSAIDKFNYHTAPSGKMFSYFAAGVPVICSNVRGLRAVADFNAGVMIDKQTPESIERAVQAIAQRHEEMSANCLAAARHFSFDRAVAPFVKHLA